MAELDLTTLFDQYTSEQQVREATAAPTIRTGKYRLKPTAATGQVDDRPDSPTPGRQSVRIQAEAYPYLAESNGNEHQGPQNIGEVGEKAGTVFFNASWHPAHNSKGNPDGQTQLWGQFFKIFDTKPTQTSVTEMVNLILAGQFDGYVTEPIQNPEGKYENYKSEEERAAMIEAGGVPKNFVQRVMKIK